MVRTLRSIPLAAWIAIPPYLLSGVIHTLYTCLHITQFRAQFRSGPSLSVFMIPQLCPFIFTLIGLHIYAPEI